MIHDQVKLGSRSGVQAELTKGMRVDDVDDSGKTPLHYTRWPNISQMLLEKGADPNAADLAGNTPLHLAAEAECPSVVRLLILKGASVCATNNVGETPHIWLQIE